MSILALLLQCFDANGQNISTFAGCNATPCSGADGTPLLSLNVGNPHFGKFDKEGNFYFSDFLGCKIRKIDTSGIITTIAGNGIVGFSGDGGLAVSSQLKYPEGIALDASGNLLIADHQNYRIRKVDKTTGIITTIVGSGVVGDSGDNDPATASSVRLFPGDIVIDKKGNIFISDNTYNKIRKVNASGIISTFAGTGVAGFSGDGGPATNAKLKYPTSMTIDDTGNLYFVDGQNKRIRKIDTMGIISTVVGNGIGLYSGDGMSALMAQIGPLGVCWYKNSLFITDSNQRIRKVGKDGIIHTVAGTGIGGYNGDNIPALTAQLNSLGGVTTDTCGNLFFMDVLNYRIRKVAFNPDCVPTAVNEPMQPAAQGLSMQPNPTTGLVTVSVGVPIHNVDIYNLLGQLVVQHAGSGKQQQQVDVSTLPPGMYIVRVNEVWTARLEKE